MVRLHPMTTRGGSAKAQSKAKAISKMLKPTKKPKMNLTDLPSEVLDQICQYIYGSSGDTVTSILPFSRVCRHLRDSAYPTIFEKVTIKTDDSVIRKCSWDFLIYLWRHPHLLKHVRCLEIRAGLELNRQYESTNIRSAQIGSNLSQKKLLDCLDLMTGLRSIKLSHVSDVTFALLAHLRHMEPNSIVVSLHWDYSEPYIYVRKGARLQQVLASLPNWTFGLSFPVARDTEHSNEMVEWLCTSKISALNWGTRSPLLQPSPLQRHSLSALEELHVSGRVTSAMSRLVMTNVIPWSNLKRLHVSGFLEVRTLLLTEAIDQLTSLEDLQLHSPATEAFHICHDPSGLSLPTQPLSITRLPALRHLSLRNICTHYPATYLTNPNLRSLSIVLDEYPARIHKINEVRTPWEIRWIAENLLHLEHLELHIGPLENLWNPTAVPGVDVNVEVYGALHAISRIRNLRTLRLFPPYIPRNAGGPPHLNARQPLTDEQAVRVFHHLLNLSPTLQTLHIAATFKELRGFTPMSWLAHAIGDGKTTLTTRQAGKNYDLEQTWIGGWRMGSRNRRHGWAQPYLPQMQNPSSWVFPAEYPYGG